MSANFKLQYRPQEPQPWFGGFVPNELDYPYDNDFKGVLFEAIATMKPIAPQDQEKVNEYLLMEYEGEDPRFEHPLNWNPDHTKLYDSGDLEFEPAFINPDLDEVWVLKSKGEEKAKEETIQITENCPNCEAWKNEALKWGTEFEKCQSEFESRKWINIKEKQPEDYQQVLIWDSRDNFMSVGYFVPSQSEIPSYNTHWMELPPSPK